jgi:L-2-hydroxyglutarate oxidase LhgO
MEKVSVTIIGAGVVGLAIAERLSRHTKEIVLIEKHESFGWETSSRNSEIIHAGLYYPSDSLKARLCVEGNRMLYELCENAGIPFKKSGKLVIANTDKEMQKVDSLFEQGRKNGVPGLRLLAREEIAKMEPDIRAEKALFSPETGIIDTHQLMKYFERKAEENNVTIAYNCEVVGLGKDGDSYKLTIRDADGESFDMESEIVINAAGLGSERIASMGGIDTEEAGYRIHFCKGEYFSVSNRHSNKLTHLVYPAPTLISLGIHAVLLLDGSLKLGPNAFYLDSLDYNVDAAHQKEFFESAKTYLPFIEYEDLSPDMSGIRSKLQGDGDDFRDFVIREESDKGLDGLINLIGIESPGLTASPAIAGFVEEILRNL